MNGTNAKKHYNIISWILFTLKQILKFQIMDTNNAENLLFGVKMKH